ncbi:MAG: hypothetical protein JJU00_03805 [Opitutales bacterium]|nr:hypothetical protein [Opitutales bacterium]
MKAFLRFPVLAPAGVLLVASALHGAMDVDVQSLDLTREFVIAADHSETVGAEAAVRFSVPGGTGAAGTFRFAWRLEREDGGAWMPVEVVGGAGPQQWVFSAPFDVDFAASPGVQNQDFSPESPLVPVSALSPYEDHRVVLQVEEESGGAWAVAEGPENTPGARLYHFTNTVSADPALNVIAVLETVTPQRVTLVESVTGMETFAAEADFTLRRYDGFADPPSLNPVTVYFEWELVRDSDDTTAASGMLSANFNVWSHDGNTPSEAQWQHLLEFQPSAPLDSTQGPYRLEVTISHEEQASPLVIRDGNTVDSPAEWYLHFTGLLRFDAIETRVTALVDAPGAPHATPSPSSPGDLLVSLEIEEAELVGSEDYTFAAPGGLETRLGSDGTAHYTGREGAVALVPPQTPDVSAVGGTGFERLGPIELTHRGMRAASRLLLPPGFGVGADTGDTVFDNHIDSAQENLRQDLLPEGGFVYDGAGTAFAAFVETHPVVFGATELVWDADTGAFTLQTTGAAVYAAEVFADLLAADPALPAEDLVKPDNAHYWDSVMGISATAVVTADAGGSARLSATFEFGSGALTAHFPQGAALRWTDGQVVLAAGEADPDASWLGGGGQVAVPHLRGCLEGDCPVAEPPETLTFDAPEVFSVTPDGGLAFFGDLSSVQSVGWGYSPATGDYAHRTDGWERGGFHMPGLWLRGEAHGFGEERAAAVLLLSAWSAAGGVLFRPIETAYRAGEGDLAGANLRSAEQDPGTLTAQSRLGDAPTGPYSLSGECAHYVVRMGTVTGVHDPDDATFPPTLDIYGYETDFASFGLAFLDGRVVGSRVNGAVHVPAPANIDVVFRSLFFDCIGNPTTAYPEAGAENRTLEYWNSPVEIFGIAFERHPMTLCDPSAPGYLSIEVETTVSHVEERLVGNVGLLPTGRVLTAADGLLPEYDSRLRMPNTIHMAGPGDEVYTVFPVTGAYYNAFDEVDPGEHPVGFLNFAARIDVPFFVDLEAHVQTSASGASIAPIHLMGEWKDGNDDDFFTLADFDAAHRGFPGGVDLIDYRAGGPDGAHYVRARQSWLGVINFEYPLEWSSSTRVFRSPDTLLDEFLVFEIDHRVVHLSAENAELKFGVSYDGMPDINLTNLVYNAIDEQTGVLSSLVAAATQEVTDSLVGGVDSFAALLNDQLDRFFDDIFEALVDPVIDDLYAELQNAWDPVAREWSSVAAYEDVVIEFLRDGQGSIREVFLELDAGLGQADGMVKQIDRYLAQAENAVRALIDEIKIDDQGNIIIDPDNFQGQVAATIDGIFKPDSSGAYPIATALARQLLFTLAPDLAQNFDKVLSEGELADWLNGLFKDAAPTLDTIRDGLLEIQGFIKAVRAELEAGGDFIAHITAIVRDAEETVDEFIEDAIETANAFFAGAGASTTQFDEYAAEEMKAFLRVTVRDAFGASSLITEIQVAIKYRIYEVQAAFLEATDSLFREVNQVIKDLVGEVLAEIDDALQGVIGDMNAVLSAGRMDGYAHINGDALRFLRIDLHLQLKVPDEMEFNGYLIIRQLKSTGSDACSVSGSTYAAEVTVGADDVPVAWIGEDLRFNVFAKFSFATFGGNTVPIGFGGGLEMVEGALEFQDVGITDFAALVSFGLLENYVAGRAHVEFDGYEFYGAVFLGRTCSLDPIRMVDRNVSLVLGDPPFTGGYVFAEGYFSILNYGCLLRLGAGAGFGVFYFVEGPTYGAKMTAQVGGEAICIFTARARMEMIAAKVGDEFNFYGEGTLRATLGICDFFCIKWRESIRLLYKNQEWKRL